MLEDDLERAKARVEALDAELADMVEREAKQNVSFERALAELGAANQRLLRAEERERLLLEQLEEAQGAGQGYGGGGDSGSGDGDEDDDGVASDDEGGD